MKTEEYTEKGIIQDYCLGMLDETEKIAFEQELETNAELRQELDAYQKGIEVYASASEENSFPPMLKNRIWDTLANLNKEENIDLGNLPLINKFSDSESWLFSVKHLLPETVGEEKFIFPLQDTPAITQLLVKSINDFEDEIHTDFLESILILEGRCECYIGGEMVELHAGEYLDIPLNEIHNVIVKSPYVVGLIQRVAV